MSSECTLVPACSTAHICCCFPQPWGFYGIFHFMAGTKFEPVKNNYAGCQQLLHFQYTPMLQQTAGHTQISPKIKVKSEEFSICSSSADCSLLAHQHASILCPSPTPLYAKQHNTEFILNLLHLNKVLSVCRGWARPAKAKLQRYDSVASHICTVGEDERTACSHTHTHKWTHKLTRRQRQTHSSESSLFGT